MKRFPRTVILSLVLTATVLALMAGCGTAPAPTSGVHKVEIIDFQKIVNARSLGGWTLSNGTEIPYDRVFRSGMLAQASNADLAQLRKLGIRTSIDLRSPAEVTKYGEDPVGPQALSHVTSAPLVGSSISATSYSDVVKNQKPSIAIAFRALAEGSTYPVDIHCVGGEDRTGIVTALLFDLLGVPQQQIVEDYLLSASSAEVQTDWIDAALNEVTAEGGINKYLAGIGIDQTMQNAIKKQILGH